MEINRSLRMASNPVTDGFDPPLVSAFFNNLEERVFANLKLTLRLALFQDSISLMSVAATFSSEFKRALLRTFSERDAPPPMGGMIC
jgi:hypothetical protein